MSKQYMMQNLHEFYLQPNVACTTNAVSEYKVSEFNATLHPHIKIISAAAVVKYQITYTFLLSFSTPNPPY